MSRRRILEVEVLENREVLSDVSGTATVLVPPPPVQSTTSAVIDPTLMPATSASTLQVYVTALGPVVNGSMTSITVQSVGAFVGSNGGIPMALQVGGQTYNIDSRTYTASGMQFTVLSGISSTGLSTGTTALVIFGPGSTPPPAVSPPPVVMPPDAIAAMATSIAAATTPPPVATTPPAVTAAPPATAPMTPEQMAQMAAQIMAAATATTTTVTPASTGSTSASGVPVTYVPPPAVVPPVDPTTMPFPQ